MKTKFQVSHYGLFKKAMKALALSIRERKVVLLRSLLLNFSQKRKVAFWDEVRVEMGAIGMNVKTTSYFRDFIWHNLRRVVVKRYRESNQSGEAGSKLPKVDEIVLDIIDKPQELISI